MIMKLKISETILRCRREKNLTQEELATAIGVSPQSISNWEHGGYPDIELLPTIANFFEISVDELIGNDKLSAEKEIRYFNEQYYKLDETERLEFALKYHRKYPNNFMLIDKLTECIIHYDFYHSLKYMKVLRNLCERIINECTETKYREQAIRRMCESTFGEEFEQWCAMLPIGYSCTYSETREEHFWKNADNEIARRLQGRNNLSMIIHLGDRDSHDLGDAKRSASYYQYQMRLILACDENADVPDGWLGRYAYFHLRYASALFGCGKTERGFSELENAVDEYLRSFDLPDNTPLPLGSPAIFNGITCIRRRKQGYFDLFIYEDGSPLDEQSEGYTFHLDAHALLHILTTGAFWFASVQENQQYTKIIKRIQTYISSK